MITKTAISAATQMLATVGAPLAIPVAAAAYNNKDRTTLVGRKNVMTATLDPELSADASGGMAPTAAGLVGGSLLLPKIQRKLVGGDNLKEFIQAVPGTEATPERIDALYNHLKLDKKDFPIRVESAVDAVGPAYKTSLKLHGTPEKLEKALRAEGWQEADIQKEKLLTKEKGNLFKNKGVVLMPTYANNTDIAMTAHELGHAASPLQNKYFMKLYHAGSMLSPKGRIIQTVSIPVTGTSAYYHKLRQLEGKDDGTTTALGAVPVATALPQAAILTEEGGASLRGYNALKNGAKLDKAALKVARNKLLRAYGTYGAIAGTVWGLPYASGVGMAHLNHYLKERRRNARKAAREARKDK